MTRASFPKASDIEDIFNYLDTDGDDTISKKEFTMLIETFTLLVEEKGIKMKMKKRL